MALTRRNAPATPAPGNAREFFRAAFFCGVGLGSDATAGDGRDDEDGIIVQTKGPFVLRCVRARPMSVLEYFLQLIFSQVRDGQLRLEPDYPAAAAAADDDAGGARLQLALLIPVLLLCPQ